MTVDSSTTFKMLGSNDELFAMMKVLCHYCARYTEKQKEEMGLPNRWPFWSIYLPKTESIKKKQDAYSVDTLDLSEISEDSLRRMISAGVKNWQTTIKDNQITINDANGPYGCSSFSDFHLIEDLAKAAPYAVFNVSMTVKYYGTKDVCSGILCDGVLRIKHNSKYDTTIRVGDPEIAKESWVNRHAKSSVFEITEMGFNIKNGVLHCYKGDDENLIIPDGTNEISSYAFQNNRQIKSVTMPDCVKKIGNGVFYNCENLHDVTFSNNIRIIPKEAFYSCKSLTSISIPEGVEVIDPYAFSNCTGLTTVVIPKGVISIGCGAFSGCSGLRTIVIPEGVTKIEGEAFSGCSGLTNVSIPGSLTTMGANVFSGCRNLQNIPVLTVVKGVASIGYMNQSGKIDPLVIKDGCVYGYTDAMEQSAVVIPKGVTCIADRAFYKCDKLGSITIPESVASIGCEAFYGCSNLYSLRIDGKTVEIGDKAFGLCKRLSRIQTKTKLTVNACGTYETHDPIVIEDLSLIPDELKPYAAIGYANEPAAPDSDREKCHIEYITTNAPSLCEIALNNAKLLGMMCWKKLLNPEVKQKYHRCAQEQENKIAISYLHDNQKMNQPSGFRIRKGILEAYTGYEYDVIIPEGINRISYCVFDGRRDIRSITIPSGVTGIGEYAFRDCINLVQVIIPDGVQSIDEKAFQRCKSLTSIIIPDSVTSIGDNAFDGCENLQKVILPKTLCKINRELFKNCKKLTGIILPKSLTNIGGKAFWGCVGLESIVIPDNVTRIGKDAFHGCKNLSSVTLPEGSLQVSEESFSKCKVLQSKTNTRWINGA